MHFSPSRTSRPVGCRSKDRGGDRVAPSGFRSDPRLPACSLDGTTVARGRDLIRVRPVASANGQSGCRTQCRHRTRLTAGDGVLGQTPYTPVGDALALGTFRTRLETRTKESSMCASHWDLTKPKGVMKVKASPRACLGRMRRTTFRRRTPGASRAHRELRRTQSVHAGTRKMVNYAWSGRSQGKP